MKRLLLALLLLVAGVLLFPIAAKDPRTATAIVREVERGPGHVFALADHTVFEWDRVFLFSPYTPRNEVEAALGFGWSGRFTSSIEDSDRVVLIVFVKDGQVVEAFDLRRSVADLAPCTDVGVKGIECRAARFSVGPTGVLSIYESPSGAAK
jgi:hypothetical protein